MERGAAEGSFCWWTEAPPSDPGERFLVSVLGEEETRLSLTADPPCEEIIQLEAFGALHLRPGARAHPTFPPLISHCTLPPPKLRRGPPVSGD